MIDILRARFACWLDGKKDRLDDLIKWIEPDSAGWQRYDAWAKKRGYYDWITKD